MLANLSTPLRPSLFDSFWMGGFESACQINTRGVRIDMLAATQHDLRVDDDYRLVRLRRH